MANQIQHQRSDMSVHSVPQTSGPGIAPSSPDTPSGGRSSQRCLRLRTHPTSLTQPVGTRLRALTRALTRTSGSHSVLDTLGTPLLQQREAMTSNSAPWDFLRISAAAATAEILDRPLYLVAAEIVTSFLPAKYSVRTTIGNKGTTTEATALQRKQFSSRQTPRRRESSRVITSKVGMQRT